jgi:low affinity Fe/Cu permease
MEKTFSLIAEKVSWAAGRPGAFVLSLALVVVWAALGPLFHYSEDWQLVINTGTTIITFLMVFLIQNSQNRDIVAIHSKLNELIRAMQGARNELIGLEHLTDQEIEEVRLKLENECSQRSSRAARPAPEPEALLATPQNV